MREKEKKNKEKRTEEKKLKRKKNVYLRQQYKRAIKLVFLDFISFFYFFLLFFLLGKYTIKKKKIFQQLSITISQFICTKSIVFVFA